MARSYHPPSDLIGASFLNRRAAATGPLPPVQLPRDELTHTSNMEWWYFVAHLEAQNGERLSVLLSAIRGTFVAADLSVCLLKVTDHETGSWPLADCGERFWSVYKESRSPVSFGFEYRAAVTNWFAPLRGNWDIRGRAGDYKLRAVLYDDDDRVTPDLDLDFHGDWPALLLCGDGVMKYGGGHELAYYVRPKLEVTGTARFASGVQRVARGLGWYERQWGTWPEGNFGWKYLNVHLDDGEQWLLFHTRMETHDKRYAACFPAGGGIVEYEPTAAQLANYTLAGRPSGTRFTLETPEGELKLDIEPLFPDEPELDSIYPGVPKFWETASRVTGTRAGKKVGGYAWTELRTYA